MESVDRVRNEVEVKTKGGSKFLKVINYPDLIFFLPKINLKRNCFLAKGDSRDPSELDVERRERRGGRGRLPQGQQGQGQGHRLHGAEGGGGGQRQISCEGGDHMNCA